MKVRAEIAAVLIGSAYLLQRIGRRSGTTAEEVRSPLPGDDLVPSLMWHSTRAIAIDAPPEDVWPWLVQMGFPSHRAGWYTPHWLDRLTFGIKDASAEEIRPDLQHLERGDRVPDSDDWSVYFTVATVDPPHALVLHSTRHVIMPIRRIDFSWAFVLRALPGGRTRLLIRARANYAPRWAVFFVELVVGVADYLNAGAMLRGIKARAEGRTAMRPTAPPAQRVESWLSLPGREPAGLEPSASGLGSLPQVQHLQGIAPHSSRGVLIRR
jgi:hypothetical protein